MFTANSMSCLSEAIGYGAAGNGTIPAVLCGAFAPRQARGMQGSSLGKKGHSSSQSSDREKRLPTRSRWILALGCSTIQRTAPDRHRAGSGVTLNLDMINDITARKVPNLCRLAPSGPHHVEDLITRRCFRGGQRADSKRLYDGSNMTVLGVSMGEAVKNAKIRNSNVIHSCKEPYSKTGGIQILKGNIAPDGSVSNARQCWTGMMVSQRQSKVFDSEEQAIKAIYGLEIQPGDVVVIRYEGRKAARVMREMLGPTSAIAGMGLDSTGGADHGRTLLRRFTGGGRDRSRFAEAARGGNIALIQDGDMIDIGHSGGQAPCTTSAKK
jgi:dihydroxy-acid dehydratase